MQTTKPGSSQTKTRSRWGRQEVPKTSIVARIPHPPQDLLPTQKIPENETPARLLTLPKTRQSDNELVQPKMPKQRHDQTFPTEGTEAQQSFPPIDPPDSRAEDDAKLAKEPGNHKMRTKPKIIATPKKIVEVAEGDREDEHEGEEEGRGKRKKKSKRRNSKGQMKTQRTVSFGRGMESPIEGRGEEEAWLQTVRTSTLAHITDELKPLYFFNIRPRRENADEPGSELSTPGFIESLSAASTKLQHYIPEGGRTDAKHTPTRPVNRQRQSVSKKPTTVRPAKIPRKANIAANNTTPISNNSKPRMNRVCNIYTRNILSKGVRNVCESYTSTKCTLP
jgi:hypothetical protein